MPKRGKGRPTEKVESKRAEQPTVQQRQKIAVSARAALEKFVPPTRNEGQIKEALERRESLYGG